MIPLKYYAQKDALGFPIPGTMMSAKKVPAVNNILQITKIMKLPLHPDGVRYYIRVDEKGNILPNSLFLHYGVLVEEGVLTLQNIEDFLITETDDQLVAENSDLFILN